MSAGRNGDYQAPPHTVITEINDQPSSSNPAAGAVSVPSILGSSLAAFCLFSCRYYPSSLHLHHTITTSPARGRSGRHTLLTLNRQGMCEASWNLRDARPALELRHGGSMSTPQEHSLHSQAIATANQAIATAG